MWDKPTYIESKGRGTLTYMNQKFGYCVTKDGRPKSRGNVEPEPDLTIRASRKRHHLPLKLASMGSMLYQVYLYLLASML
jgi:hypothetical protein